MERKFYLQPRNANIAVNGSLIRKKKEDEQLSILCPVCVEPIEKGTKVCPYCHEVLVEEEMQVVQPESVVQNISVSDHLENTANDIQDDNSRSFFAYYCVDVFLSIMLILKGKLVVSNFGWDIYAMQFLCLY